LFALAALFSAGCATIVPTGGEREYLDDQTAATVTVREPALVFARERPELAVNARDYLTLVPVDVNRSGTHVQYYFGYVWSTIDKRRVGGIRTDAPRFELIADGRRIQLEPYPGEPRTLGLGEAPLPRPARSAQVLVSQVSRDTQEFVEQATELRAVAMNDGVSERFELWSR
jgi:hypothetical protein